MMFFHNCQPKYKAIVTALGICSCAAATLQRCEEVDGWIVCPVCGKLELVEPGENHDTAF
jgi:hypothetical protein